MSVLCTTTRLGNQKWNCSLNDTINFLPSTIVGIFNVIQDTSYTQFILLNSSVANVRTNWICSASYTSSNVLRSFVRYADRLIVFRRNEQRLERRNDTIRQTGRRTRRSPGFVDREDVRATIRRYQRRARATVLSAVSCLRRR